MKKFRQFKSSKPKEEKKNKAGIYLSIFLAVIMVGSIAGIFIGNPSQGQEYTYGKYSFKNVNNIWSTKINKKEVAFYYLPDQLIASQVPVAVHKKIQASQGLIISFNPRINETTRLQAVDIFRFELVNAFISATPTKQVGFSITEKSSAYSLPPINCNNATFYVPVMTVDYGNESRVSLEGDCIVVSATDEYGLLAIGDNLKYHIYGILNEEGN
jgi:hypothetical protein